MKRELELLDVRVVQRGGSLIARIGVRVGGFLVIRGIEIHHRRDDGVVFLKLPQAVGWATRKIASRFNVAVLTRLGFEHPELLKNGRLAAPLFGGVEAGIPENLKQVGEAPTQKA
jgi:hypothetical protein